MDTLLEHGSRLSLRLNLGHGFGQRIVTSGNFIQLFVASPGGCTKLWYISLQLVDSIQRDAPQTGNRRPMKEEAPKDCVVDHVQLLGHGVTDLFVEVEGQTIMWRCACHEEVLSNRFMG